MASRRRKQVYLLGFMGSGKSTVGKLLAGALRWPFIDLDTIIQGGRGMAIKEIFEQAGEPFFRQLETAALAEVVKIEPAVIALGGGTFVQAANRDLIRESGGITLWLDCPVSELVGRCAQIPDRPLFRDRESFEQLYEQRLPFYQLAEYRVSSEGRLPPDVVEQILSLGVF